MRLLFLGTVCNADEYEKMLEHCSEKCSPASLYFESAVLRELSLRGIAADIISFPQIPQYRHSGILFWGRKRQRLDCGYDCTWIPTVNIPIPKAMSRGIFSRRMIRQWMRKNKDEDASVLLYSVCPFLAGYLTRLCRRCGKKCVVIVPDLPGNMFINHRLGKVKSLFAKAYVRHAEKAQTHFDGYVYLTESMRDKINPNAAFTVVEGIADTGLFDGIEGEKTDKRAIMYAGRLHENYGVGALIEAYERVKNGSTELWLFGSGDMEDRIKALAEKDGTVRFFGQQPRKTVLSYEKRASILVNCRDPNDSYVKYSFPSKLIEYMLSGTPVLTTRLAGIPEEYYGYVYSAADNSAMTLADKLSELLLSDEKELADFGQRAGEFIKNNKNAAKQTDKILKLLSGTECCDGKI